MSAAGQCGEGALRRIARPEATSGLGCADATVDGDRARRGLGDHGTVAARLQRDEAAVDDQPLTGGQHQRGEHVVAGRSVQGSIAHEDLPVRRRTPRWPERFCHSPPSACSIGTAVLGRPFAHRGVSLLPLVQPAQLPEPEVHHHHGEYEDAERERDPLRTAEERVHGSGRYRRASRWRARPSAHRCARRTRSARASQPRARRCRRCRRGRR